MVTLSIFAQAVVTAAALSIWPPRWVLMALCIPIPSVSVITAFSIASVCEGARETVAVAAWLTESVIWLLTFVVLIIGTIWFGDQLASAFKMPGLLATDEMRRRQCNPRGQASVPPPRPGPSNNKRY